jgi:hypothetical protein
MKPLSSLAAFLGALFFCTAAFAQQHTAPKPTTTIRYPNGTVEVHRPNGTVTIESQGQGKTFYPNGTQQGYLIGPNGQHFGGRVCSGGAGTPTSCTYNNPLPSGQ